MSNEFKDARILLVDDNQGVLKSLKLLLEEKFEVVECISKPALIPEVIRRGNFDIVILDMNFAAGVNTGNEGLFWLNEILKIDKTISVVLLTAYGSIDLAIKAVKMGASDFVEKPWDNKKLLGSLHSALRLRISKRKVRELTEKQKHLNRAQMNKAEVLYPGSAVMKDLFSRIQKIADTDVNVLILGESGTGKEIFAREIHRMSARKDEAFIELDLGTVGESVFESELFGHKKGSFTDAREDRMGRVQVADGGTLFLDEIGNIPLSLQVKLLNLIQNKKITPIGAGLPVNVDVRLVCATNMDLAGMVREGSFREDLFYRINSFQLTIPPLRERPGDIEEFANYFLARYQNKYLKEGLCFDENALDWIRSYSWPGNIRELKHAVERAVILCESKSLKPADLKPASDTGFFQGPANPTLEQSEKEAVMQALTKNDGNISKTADQLGITRQTLYAKIRKYGL